MTDRCPRCDECGTGGGGLCPDCRDDAEVHTVGPPSTRGLLRRALSDRDRLTFYAASLLLVLAIGWTVFLVEVGCA